MQEKIKETICKQQSNKIIVCVFLHWNGWPWITIVHHILTGKVVSNYMKMGLPVTGPKIYNKNWCVCKESYHHGNSQHFAALCSFLFRCHLRPRWTMHNNITNIDTPLRSFVSFPFSEFLQTFVLCICLLLSLKALDTYVWKTAGFMRACILASLFSNHLNSFLWKPKIHWSLCACLFASSCTHADAESRVRTETHAHTLTHWLTYFALYECVPKAPHTSHTWCGLYRCRLMCLQ